MRTLTIDRNFKADYVESEGSRCGEIYHVRRNRAGGGTWTPIARYFAWRPVFIENFHPHWRIDCFVRKHKLAPRPEKLGRALATSLIEAGLCERPVWVSWHKSEELGGDAYGEVFDFD